MALAAERPGRGVVGMAAGRSGEVVGSGLGAGPHRNRYGSTVAQGWSLLGSVPLGVGLQIGGASVAFGSPPW